MKKFIRMCEACEGYIDFLEMLNLIDAEHLVAVEGLSYNNELFDNALEGAANRIKNELAKDDKKTPDDKSIKLMMSIGFKYAKMNYFDRYLLEFPSNDLKNRFDDLFTKMVKEITELSNCNDQNKKKKHIDTLITYYDELEGILYRCLDILTTNVIDDNFRNSTIGKKLNSGRYLYEFPMKKFINIMEMAWKNMNNDPESQKIMIKTMRRMNGAVQSLMRKNDVKRAANLAAAYEYSQQRENNRDMYDASLT